MTWQEVNLMLQLEAEERIGWLLRERVRQAHAAEDAAWAAATKQGS